MIKLKSIRINKYKSIIATQNVLLDESVTSLVGMNESGKTVFLEVLAKSNYFIPGDKLFEPTLDYPRKELKKYQRDGQTAEVARLVFTLSDSLLTSVSADLGYLPVKEKEIEIGINYDNHKVYYSLNQDFDAFLQYKIDKSNLPTDLKPEAKKLKSIDEITSFIESIENETLKQFFIELKNTYIADDDGFKNKLNGYFVNKYILPYLPKFWYYDEYFELPSRININHLKNESIKNSDHLKTAKALFELANIDIDQLLSSDNFESFIAELEATSAEITEELFKYWTTNQNIEVKFAIDTIEIQKNVGGHIQKNFEKVLDIRVWNQKHKVSLPLSQRSKGFNWFFSFIVWFSKIQSDTSGNYILLLDEPGLNLHAAAQVDLLRYINDLAEKYQIIYTTHSPFMIDSSQLHRVRTVMDTQEGTKISETIQEKDPNTLFPLQAALGYDIAQNLFISKQNLIVEGVSDLMYLTIISEALIQKGRNGLSGEFTIVPAGGLDKVSSFISLLRGSELNIVCLLDTFADQSSKARLDNMISSQIINNKNILFFHDFTKKVYSEIEDLFNIEEYISIFNLTFKNKYTIDINKLDQTITGIVKQINANLGITRYNHYSVAREYSKAISTGIEIHDETLKNFESIFVRINATLSK